MQFEQEVHLQDPSVAAPISAAATAAAAIVTVPLAAAIAAITTTTIRAAALIAATYLWAGHRKERGEQPVRARLPQRTRRARLRLGVKLGERDRVGIFWYARSRVGIFWYA